MSESREPKAYWDRRAAEVADDALVSIADQNQRRLELGVAAGLIGPKDRVLDLGCANGVSTREFSARARAVVGLDFSWRMLARARQFGAHFVNGDAVNLPFRSNSFDLVLSIRCVINLLDWEQQQTAIEEALRVTKPGGKVALLEGMARGRRALNALRLKAGLQEMPEVAHNLDLDEDLLVPFLEERCEIVEVRKFGVYDFISRICHPLIVAPAEPSYDSKINAVAADLALHVDGFDEISRLGLYVIRKRGL